MNNNDANTNIIIDGIGGIPSLPSFIGNYLLDLTSAFFPIFIVLSSFVMVYIGFTRGSGDWKQTLQAISPTLVSIIIIFSLLSMKSESTSNNSYFKNTNNYVIVDMMNTFLGFGSVFADALTHKILYGTLDITQSRASSFDGYFPNFLQALVDKNEQKVEVAKQVLKSDNKEKIEDELQSMELDIASNFNMLLYDLKKNKFVENAHEVTNKSSLKSPFFFNEHGRLEFAKTSIVFDLENFKNDEIEAISFDNKIEVDNKFLKAFATYEKDLYNLNSKFLILKINEFNKYNDMQINLEKTLESLDNKQSKTLIQNEISDLVNKKDIVKKQINHSVQLEKDYINILKNYELDYEITSQNELDKIFRNGYTSSLKDFNIISETTQTQIKFRIDNMKKRKIANYNYYSSEFSISIKQLFDATFFDKNFIVNEFYAPFYNLIKEDALLRTNLQDNSKSIFALTLLQSSSLDTLIANDEKRKEIAKNYIDEVTNKVDVRAKLEKELKEQNEKIGDSVINWQDLGKHYSTFKNVFAPSMTSSIAMQGLGQMKNERNNELVLFMKEQEPSEKSNRMINAGIGAGIVEGVSEVAKGFFNGGKAGAIKGGITGIWEAIKTIGLMPILLFFVNVLMPSFVWMFAILTYYVEMSIYLALVPISIIFMIFQSYRQAFTQYVNVLISLILLPVVLTSIYFVVLYIDMLIPIFMHDFLPFFKGYDEFSSAIMSNGSGFINSSVGIVGGGIMELLGTTIYTIINIVLSSILILTFLRANEYMTKILNVSTLGNDASQGRDALNKFSSFNSKNLARA